MILSKKITASKLTECGLTKKQVTTLVRDYELTLAQLFLKTAALRGKVTLPPEEESLKYRLPPPHMEAEAQRVLLPLVQVTGDGKLSVNPDSLPGGFVDRWEKVATLGAALPPSIWESHLRLTPAQLVAIDCDDMTRKYLKESWRTAAIRYCDENWFSALTKSRFFYDLAFQMLVRVPQDAGERLALEMIASNGGTWRLADVNPVADDAIHQVMMFTIRGLAWDWSEEFAEALLPLLQREVDAPLPKISEWLLDDAAIYFPVSMQQVFSDATRCATTLQLKAEIWSTLI